MRFDIKKDISLIKTFIVLSMVLSLAFVQTANAGTVEKDMTTSPCNGRLMDFENGIDRQVVSTTVPGLSFTTSGGVDWLIGDFSTGNYNGKYPNGGFTSDGDKWAWMGESQPNGRIDFIYGTATYFSFLTSTISGLALEAYDINGNLVDRAPDNGVTVSNFDTGLMDRLNVNASGIAYIIIHDSGNQFLIDDICTDAPSHPAGAPAIIGYSPESPVSDIAGTTRSFNITVNQTVNVTWYINGTEISSQTGVTESTFTNTAIPGTWIVNSTASTANGTASKEWIWTVDAGPIPPVPELNTIILIPAGMLAIMLLTWRYRKD